MKAVFETFPTLTYRVSPSSASAATLAWQAGLIFLVAFAVRLIDAGRPPVHHDELYHILAARSYWSEGSFRIWSGHYPRAAAFTALVGWSIGYVGDSLFGARFPSVVSGALLVAAGFVWLHRAAGTGAAWVFALLLCISSFALHISHFARFYALQGLLFFLGAIAVYAVVTRAYSRSSYGWLLLGAFALAGACHLQVATLIGIAALGVWAVAYTALRPDVRAFFRSRRARLTLALGGIPAIAALVLLAHFTGLLGALYAEYRWVALWNAGLRDHARFYVHHFAGDMPLLFYLFPIAALLAVAHAPRPAIFCLTVSIIALILHSFGGMKGERYVYYTYPFVFSIWAIAVAVVLPYIYGAGMTVFVRARALTQPASAARSSATGFSGRLSRAAVGTMLAAAIFVALAGNPDFATVRTIPLAVARAASGESRAATELAVEAKTREALRRIVDAGAVLASSNELAALYYLGHFDVAVRASRLDEIKSKREFARDPRTGGPVIGTAASLRQIVSCYPSGTLLVWFQDWGVPWVIGPEMVSFIESSLQEVKLPGTLKVRAFRWEHAASPDAACDTVRRALAPRGTPASARLSAVAAAR